MYFIRRSLSRALAMYFLKKFTEFKKKEGKKSTPGKINNLCEIEKQVRDFSSEYFGDLWLYLDKDETVTFMMVLIFANQVTVDKSG